MLRDDIDLAAFFAAVNRCQGEVLFLSEEGDRMNLKSTLCQYLFTSVYLQKDIKLEGQIVCALPEDAETLAPFLRMYTTER
ncbi:MAG: polya polymerase [Lachnospiraceae bacterium]|nr:polya polymerase [Acetatifactor muris]MCM1218593.1 polya polymerase [Lachnospiraceae bacterium]